MCLRQFKAQWEEHVHSGKHKTFAFALLSSHRSDTVRSPAKNLPKCLPKQTCLLPECQLVMSAGRALVNRGAERSIKLEMYSCAWRYTPTQGDKSSSSQPEARIRSGTREREASHTKPMVMQNLFHINFTSFPSAWQWTGLLSLGAQIILNYCGKARRGDVT